MTNKKLSLEKDKDYGWASDERLLVNVPGTRQDSFFKPYLKTRLAVSPWNKEPLPDAAKAVLDELIPGLNDQELFLFLNNWQRYLEGKEQEKSWPSPRQIGAEISAIYDAASSLLHTIDASHLKTILLLADRYHRLNGHPQAPYIPAHLTQELCRLMTAICEDHFMFEWSKAARDNVKGSTPMTRSGADLDFVGSVYFFLEPLLRRRPTYSELQKLIDAFCGKEQALKGLVQKITNQKNQAGSV